MSATWFLLVLLQFSQLPTAQTASLSSPANNARFSSPKATNLTTATHAGSPLLNPENELSVYFTNPGVPIPAAELSRTLTVASADVETYLPHFADEPIAQSFFERSIKFPETGNVVSITVQDFGIGLSWRQLSDTLYIVQGHVLGLGPGHPHTHYQQLEFYVQLAPGIEVAHGAVGFTSGAKADAKRNLITTTLQLPHVNSSSLRDPVVLPIIFSIPHSNIDLIITSLGVAIPESTILDTIEEAFTDVILNHTDIDALIPATRPYSFNATSGRRSHLFETEISISVYPGKEISWGLLCILFYGLRDFMNERRHFNALHYVVNDGRLGYLGHGDIRYRPVVGAVKRQRLVRKQGSRGMRGAT